MARVLHLAGDTVMFGYWKRRALEAEAALAQAHEAFDSLQKLVDSRAALVSITRKGRTARLLFIRNNELTAIETYVTMETDWNEIERKLLR